MHEIMMMSLFVNRFLLLRYFIWRLNKNIRFFETSEKIVVPVYKTNGQISLYADHFGSVVLSVTELVFFDAWREFIYKMYILWLCKLSPYFVCSPSGKDIKGVEWTLSLPPIVSIIEGLGKTPWWFFLGIVSYYVRSPHNIHLIITNTSVCEMYRSLLTKGIQSCGIAKNKEYSFWQPVWQHSIFGEKVPSSQFTYKQ